VLWLALVGCATIALEFALDAEVFVRPWIALAGLAFLVVAMVMARTVPWVRRDTRTGPLFEIIGLGIFAILSVAAASPALGHLQALVALPLAAAALRFGARGAALTGLLLLLAGTTVALGVTTESSLGALAARWLVPWSIALVTTILLGDMAGRLADARRHLQRLTSRDLSTGFLNLAAFEAALEAEHESAERESRPYSVLVIDVEGVAEVNDMYGREAGSRLISSAGEVARRAIRDSDLIGRLGGDEFVALLVAADPGTAAEIAQRIRNSSHASTVAVGKRMLRLGVHVGHASWPVDGLRGRELLVVADRRMREDRALRRPSRAS
jgi:diguanylate cyclase (GGDEF)-like protein